MVEWNRIFRLFQFSGILGQPREVHPKFQNEIPENVCSIRFPIQNFQNFWLNGKCPSFPEFQQDFKKEIEFQKSSFKLLNFILIEESNFMAVLSL